MAMPMPTIRGDHGGDSDLTESTVKRALRYLQADREVKDPDDGRRRRGHMQDCLECVPTTERQWLDLAEIAGIPRLCEGERAILVDRGGGHQRPPRGSLDGPPYIYTN